MHNKMDTSHARRKSHAARTPSYAAPLLAICALLSACAGLKDLGQPTLNFSTLELSEPTLTGATLNFIWKVRNPNAFALKLGDIDYALEIDGKKLGDGTLPANTAVPAKGEAQLRVPLKVNYLELAGSLMELIKKDKAAYKLSGRVHYGPLSLPFSRAGDWNLPRLPTLKVQKISFDGATRLVAQIEFNNPNAFAVPLSGLDYDFQMGGRSVAGGKAALSELRGAGTTQLSLPLDLKLADLMRGLDGVIRGGPADYRIQSQLRVPNPGGGEATLPLVDQGSTRVDRAP